MLPPFTASFLCCFTGRWYVRLVTGVIFFSLFMPFNMIIDTVWTYDSRLFPIIIKYIPCALCWLTVRRFVPKSFRLFTSARLWALLGVLSLAPLLATLIFSIWNANRFWKDIFEVYRSVAIPLGYTLLPFASFSAAALLAALVVLSRHEELERKQRLSETQEIYYQGLRREQAGLRAIRHDLNNHISVVRGMLLRGEHGNAEKYLEEMSGSTALTGTVRFCGNETANAILAGKTAEMEREGITPDFVIDLPKELPVADTDLCAILGNALDNAIEAVRTADDKRILLRARSDKGALMLRVENATSAAPQMINGKFKTTKTDASSHGIGMASMEEAVRRYDGMLEAKAQDGRFELTVFLTLKEK
jgi:sensor histidine kinase YesM